MFDVIHVHEKISYQHEIVTGDRPRIYIDVLPILYNLYKIDLRHL